MNNARRDVILVIDDIREFALEISSRLAAQGFEPMVASTGVESIQALKSHFVDLLLVDEKLGRYSGTHLIGECRRIVPGISGILMSGYADLDMAVRAMQAGAVDLIPKTTSDEELISRIRDALAASSLSREARYHRWQAAHMTEVPEIIGSSAALQQAISLIRKLAPTDATVLVQGESGTGKELAARALHSLSRRSGGPFRAVNAGALPPTLLEATLFGSRKGSYTDSKADQLGLFEAANGGTVFLDEVGEMTPDLQVRLLRVLQERKITRIGEFEERSVDVRVIAATNRDLRAEVAAKRFREDLFYRVSVVRLQLPPLRDRIPDIEPLARHMIDKHGQRLGRQLKGIESAAIEKLQHYRWPGNVRELENVIERAIALSDTDQITVADIEIEPPSSDGQMALQEILDHPFRDSEMLFEQAYFQRLLSRTRNNKTKAAELAGLDRSSLHAHLRKIGRGPSDD